MEIVESYLLWIHKSIPPSVESLGRGGQNPLLLEAFRLLGAADARKEDRDDLRRKNEQAAAKGTQRAG